MIKKVKSEENIKFANEIWTESLYAYIDSTPSIEVVHGNGVFSYKSISGNQFFSFYNYKSFNIISEEKFLQIIKRHSNKPLFIYEDERYFENYREFNNGNYEPMKIIEFEKTVNSEIR
jgi:hypothetical protein